MKNNLLNKYLLSSYIVAALFMGMVGAATFFAKKDIQMAKDNPENKDIVDRCRTTYFMCLSIIIVSIILAVFSGLTYPMIVRGRVKNMTKDYLQGLFVRHPEIRQYRFILEDSKKLHEIAAIACNGLTENEQKEILNLVDREMKDSVPSNVNAKLHKIETFVMDVVQKHAEKDPEYMNKILSAIASAQRPNVMKTIQKVR